MKTTLAAFFALLIAAQPLLPQQDFRISDTRSPSTYVQRSPYLYSAGEQGFIVAWEDFRLGDSGFYAQWFDAQANPAGSNFRIDNNRHIKVNTDGGYMVLGETRRDVPFPYDGTMVTASGYIYDQNNLLLSENYIGDGFHGGCYSGFFGYWYDLTSMNEYYYVTTNVGGYSVRKYNKNGTQVYDYTPENTSAGSVAIAATADEHYVGISFYPEQWEISSGVYAIFFNDADSILTDTVRILSYDSRMHAYEEDVPHIAAVTVSDTLYRFFIAEQDSLKLYSVIYDQKGNLIEAISEYSLGDTESYGRIENIQIIEQRNGDIKLLIPYSSSTESGIDIFIFSPDGTFIDRKTSNSTTDRFFLRGTYQVSDGMYYLTGSMNDDVHLFTLDNGSITDTLKINDDTEGSNQKRPAITIVNRDKYFVSWQEEKGTYGREVGTIGTVYGESVKLDRRVSAFSEDGTGLVMWSARIDDIQYGNGYSLYDQQWNLIKVDTLVLSSQYYEIDAKGFFIGDNRFLILYHEDNIIDAKVISSDGTVYVENRITDNNNRTSTYNTYTHSSEGIWITWQEVPGDNYGRMYDFELQPIDESHPIPWGANIYLGEKIYLNAYWYWPHMYPGPHYYGSILTMSGDTLVHHFRIASFTDDLRLARLNDEHFMAVYRTWGNQLYGKVFHREGVALADSFLIHQQTGGAKIDPQIRVNNGDVLAVWSDNRSADRGYDIYGRVFKVADLTTSVPEPITGNFPDEYRLYQNYPNPFNPGTTIEYSIPQSARVKISVYDLLGREIAVLVDEYQNTGSYRVDFDASGLSSGIYIYRLRAGGYSLVKRMSLIK